jgi:hypothetical protein
VAVNPIHCRHGDADIAPFPKILDDCLGSSAIAAGVKHDRGIKADVNRGRIRPGDRGHLLAAVLAHVRIGAGALRWREHRQVSGFVQKIAKVRQARSIDQENAAVNPDAGQDTFRNRSGPQLETDPGEKIHDFGCDRVFQERLVHSICAPRQKGSIIAFAINVYMETLVQNSLPARTETGSLGVCHMKRFWARTKLAPTGPIASDAEEWSLDTILIYGLGLGIEEIFRYLYKNDPPFDQFEQWVLEKNGGSIEPERIARINAAVTGQPVEPDPELERSAPVLTADDFAFWDENGYVIVHDAVPEESRAGAEQAIWEAAGADPQDPATWYGGPQGHSIMVSLVLHHWAFEANRKSLRLRKAFSQIWDRGDIWISVDRGGFNPPELPFWRFPGPYLHWDADLTRPIPFSVGGILYLTDTAPDQGAFQCVPGFHRRVEAWVKSLPPGANPWEQNLATLGAVPIPGRAGDLIIWRQELPHGSSPNRAKKPRIVQYIAAGPMSLAGTN